MKRLSVMLALALVFTVVQAQEPPTTPPSEAEEADGAPPPTPEALAEPGGDAAAPDAPPPPPPPPPEPTGDTIILKSGRMLEGFQIERETPVYYVIELIPGKSLTLRLPRSQVESVEYDNFDPRRDRDALGGQASRKPVLLPSREIPETLAAKLNAGISGPPMRFEEKDILDAIREISERTGVTITAEDAVAALPQEARLWTYETAPGSTVLALLEAMDRQLEAVDVAYRGDSVVLVAKKAVPHPPPPAEPPSE